jgi:hypothetical protein
MSSAAWKRGTDFSGMAWTGTFLLPVVVRQLEEIMAVAADWRQVMHRSRLLVSACIVSLGAASPDKPVDVDTNSMAN